MSATWYLPKFALGFGLVRGFLGVSLPGLRFGLLLFGVFCSVWFCLVFRLFALVVFHLAIQLVFGLVILFGLLCFLACLWVLFFLFSGVLSVVDFCCRPFVFFFRFLALLRGLLRLLIIF